MIETFVPYFDPINSDKFFQHQYSAYLSTHRYDLKGVYSINIQEQKLVNL